MPEDITVNKKLGIIEVNSYGKVTHEDSLASLATLEALIKETAILKVLSDTQKQDSAPSTFNIYDFGVNLPRQLKIAIIASKDQTTSQDVTFLDNVAHNRGVNIKIFSSRNEALEWLRN